MDKYMHTLLHRPSEDGSEESQTGQTHCKYSIDATSMFVAVAM